MSVLSFDYRGVNYKVRELVVSEITSDVVSFIKSKKIKEANEMASLLSGKDKTDFLNSVWKTLPTSAEVFETLDQWLKSLEGLQYIIDKACTPKLVFDLNKINEIEPVIMQALGSFVEKKDVVTEEAPKEANFSTP
jgi:hypothetical protein